MGKGIYVLNCKQSQEDRDISQNEDLKIRENPIRKTYKTT